MIKVLIIGSSGQLGQTLIKTKPSNIELLTCNREEVDLYNSEEIYNFIKRINPEFTLNVAAYTAVDKAENYPNLAFKINAEAVNYISKAVYELKQELIHISTDFVFDGEKSTAYNPSDKVNPLGVYGKSKAKGERYLLNSDKSTIIRTSWLYGDFGQNFCLTMLKLHKENSTLSKPIYVVADQIGVPTSCYSLSRVCWELIKSTTENKKIDPILHWCDAGVASWYDFSVAIGEIGVEIGLIKKMAEVIPIKSDQYSTLAKRPHFSLLNCTETVNLLGVKQIHWRSELYKVIEKVKIKES